jgi:hypothetical protein
MMVENVRLGWIGIPSSRARMWRTAHQPHHHSNFTLPPPHDKSTLTLDMAR